MQVRKKGYSYFYPPTKEALNFHQVLDLVTRLEQCAAEDFPYKEIPFHAFTSSVICNIFLFLNVAKISDFFAFYQALKHWRTCELTFKEFKFCIKKNINKIMRKARHHPEFLPIMSAFCMNSIKLWHSKNAKSRK